jgi:hypothetical protein
MPRHRTVFAATRRRAVAAVLAAGVAMVGFAPVGRADAETLPSVSIGGGAVVEGHINRRYIRFTIVLSQVSAAPVTVQYATGDPGDTASAPADYASKSATLTFLPGQRVKLVGIRVWTDATDEPDETFTVRLFNVTGATLGHATATGTIIDDDPFVGNRVSIGDGVAPQMCVNANTTPGPVLVTTASALGVEPETVHVATSDLTAVAGVDYKPVSKTVTFKSGQSVKEIRIPVFADTVVEGPKQIRVTLTVVSGPLAALRTEGTVTILDCV